MSVSFKKMPTISKKVSIFLVTLVAVFSTASITRVVRSSALSGSEFQASNIIDDAIFFNSQSMGVDQIQAFLNSKVPVCDTNGTQPIYGTTRAAYGASQGHPAPYTCLKDYTQTIPSLVNSGSDLCGGTISAGTKSAAQIIYDVSRICGINPQVLIVLLQKEQSLITDEWPWDTQYRSATGYGCPDTAPCDSQYYGFFNQVYQAAKAFRRYEANPDSYNYKANRNNFIYYHPSLGACGGTNVYIQNQATANLYIYTPYQPNSAALSNLYGTGDGCSAYGNRNFWRMFNDWFGSTIAPNGGIQLASSLAVSFPGSTIEKGELVTASFDVTNNSDIYINAGKLGVCGRINNKWYDFGTDYVYLNGDQTKTITKSKVVNTSGKLDLFICSYSYLLGGWASDIYPYNLNGYTRTFTESVQQNPLLTAGISLDGAPAVNSLSTVTFTITNKSESPINAGTLVVAARDPNGNNVDFPADYNVVIPANGTYKYTKSRIFNSPGRHDLFIANYNNGKWDLNFPEGTSGGAVRSRDTYVDKTPLLTSGVSLSGTPVVNSLSTVTFTITNKSESPINAGTLVVAARDPNGNNVDFPADYNVVIPANGTYKYTKSRIFNSPGRHDLFIANYNNGKWDLNFPEGTSGGAVRSRDTYVVSNPILTNPIVLWSTPTVGNPVTASFKIKNASNSPLNIGTIVIAARDPNGNNVDFPADYNVVIPANGTYTHVVTRAFNSAGEHKLFIANYNNGKWDLNFPEAITYGIERIRTTFVSN